MVFCVPSRAMYATGWVFKVCRFSKWRNMVWFSTMTMVACWPFTKPRFLSLFCVITTFIPLCKGIGGKSESQFPIRRAHSPSKDLSTTREFIWLEAFLATVSTVPVGCEDKVSKIRLSEGNPSQIRWSWMGSSNAQVVGPFSHVIEKWLQFGICASELLHEFVMWHFWHFWQRNGRGWELFWMTLWKIRSSHWFSFNVLKYL